ncbi:hypothetical protein TNCV_4367691 [Trichonephila clavipes]|nr:hypothetical protein TNCV_4367691 [Trichonephila clavipes]
MTKSVTNIPRVASEFNGSKTFRSQTGGEYFSIRDSSLDTFRSFDPGRGWRESDILPHSGPLISFFPVASRFSAYAALAALCDDCSGNNLRAPMTKSI